MTLDMLLPHLRGFRLCTITVGDSEIDLALRPKNQTARCPCCSTRTRSVHSHYPRTLIDLPLSGVRVRLGLRVRRFRCRQRSCAQSIFCERLETLTRPYARSTRSHFATLQTLGLALGGNAGARIAAELRVPVSASTMLRRVHTIEEPPSGKVRVLGVDDWALRKGQRYGTLLCDLERGCPVDLLADRSAETLAAWLRRHPEIEIISRDRGGIYAEGAAAGAPQAQQVADRFHLLQNLADALRKILDRHYADLKAASEPDTNTAFPPEIQPDATAAREPIPAAPPSSAQQRRQAFFEEVRQLAAAGYSLRAISRNLGVSRVTVKRYANATTSPPSVRRDYPLSQTVLAGFTAIVDGRLAEGVPSLTALFEELRLAGYRGGKARIYAYVRKYHPNFKCRHRKRSQAPGTTTPTNLYRLSARSATWLLFRKESTLDAREQGLRERLVNVNAEIATADGLVQRFATMVRMRQADRLDDWLDDAAVCDIDELKGLAKSLKQDYAAVRASLTLPWSNGPVEGHINRLKLIKRSMYGRAGMVLLRKRYLCAR
jgi:transposase